MKAELLLVLTFRATHFKHVLQVTLQLEALNITEVCLQSQFFNTPQPVSDNRTATAIGDRSKYFVRVRRAAAAGSEIMLCKARHC